MLALLLPLLILCCFGPGFFLIRRFRLTADERICLSIAISVVLIYLLSWTVYISQKPWGWCWLITLLFAAMTVASARDFSRFLVKRHVRQRLAAFGLLVLLMLLMLAMIEHYSGGVWAQDYEEHFQRARFFLYRMSYNTLFIDKYTLPARPPLMHLVATFFMAQTGDRNDLFQVISAFLNTLVFFPLVLLAGLIVRRGNRRVWIIAAFLAASPVFVQNVTFVWNKLFAAFFVILSVALYMRAIRGNSPYRLITAAGIMAAGILTHFSVGPYALCIGLHYLFTIPRRRHRSLEFAGAAAICIFLLACWFGWSFKNYGWQTLTANTTVAGSASLTPRENILKIGLNSYRSLIPFPLRVWPDEFARAFLQPNPYGLVRDAYFLFAQQTLPGSLGLIGWAFVLLLLFRSLRNAATRDLIFWIFFIGFTTIAGISTLGSDDPFGVAHICLQPLTLMGITLLAVGLPLLAPWMRVSLAATMMVGIALGIILHIRVQMLPIRGVDFNQCDIVPLTNGLIGVQGVCNSFVRFSKKIPYFADLFTPVAGLLVVMLIVAYAAIAYFIGKVTAPARPRLLAGVMLALFAPLAIACVTDQWAGYRVASTLPIETSTDPEKVRQILEPFQEEVKANWESAEAHFRLARTYYYLGQFDPSWKESIDAVRLNPEDPDARYLLGMFLIAYHGASPQQQAAISPLYDGTFRDTASRYLSYATEMMLRGFQHKGLEALADAIRRYPDDAGAHLLYGAALMDTHQPAPAIVETEKALRLSPDLASAADQLRRFLISQQLDPVSADLRIQAVRAGQP